MASEVNNMAIMAHDKFDIRGVNICSLVCCFDKQQSIFY